MSFKIVSLGADSTWWKKPVKTAPQKNLTGPKVGEYPRTLQMYVEGHSKQNTKRIDTKERVQSAIPDLPPALNHVLQKQIDKQKESNGKVVQRSSHIHNDFIPSPCRYESKKPRSQSAAFACKADRNIDPFKVTLDHIEIPSPFEYDPKKMRQEPKVEHLLYASERFVPKREAKITPLMAKMQDKFKDCDISYSQIDKKVHGGPIPREGHGCDSRVVNNAEFVGPGSYDVRYGYAGK